ncbi:MAG: hypothetical protein F4X26_11935 [Chloroflexi bacterium]|nr:hypothetical protein [Chloroflexota bacterium]MYD66668.1 hypothetical protein [Chloroflexota bacterium]
MQSQKSTEETARLGRELYERDIEPQLDASRTNSFVAVDIDSGEWTIAERDIDACDALYARRPDAVNVYVARLGHRVAVRMRHAQARRALG